MALPAWAPTLPQVASYVPWLTVNTAVPGAQEYLNTFTSTTSPTDTVATSHIDDACVLISAAIPTMPASLHALAATVAARFAAATLAAAYARTDDDARRAAALLAAANTALTGLTDAADNEGAAALSPQPVIYAPDPVPWGDDLLLGVTSSYPRQYLYPE